MTTIRQIFSVALPVFLLAQIAILIACSTPRDPQSTAEIYLETKDVGDSGWLQSFREESGVLQCIVAFDGNSRILTVNRLPKSRSLFIAKTITGAQIIAIETNGEISAAFLSENEKNKFHRISTQNYETYKLGDLIPRSVILHAP